MNQTRAGGRTPAPPGRGASRMLRGLMLRRRAVLGTPKCEKSVGRPGLRPGPRWGSLQRSPRPLAGGEGLRGGFPAPLPKNPTYKLQYFHCACPVCMYTRVWKCTVIFSWMLNTGPHSCIWGGDLQLSSAGTEPDFCPYRGPIPC